MQIKSRSNRYTASQRVRQDAIRRLFYVKENLIPFQFYGIRNLLISLGFFERYSTLGSNDLFVKADFTELFEALVVNPLRAERENQTRRITLSGLKIRQERQEELGEQAEIFAMEFEQRRLQGHPLIQNIRRVSREYINAGFDIESFNDIESVFLDRFIEVKSYSDKVVFYWSRNEIETAQEFTDKYFLYLVDRNKMNRSDYMPRIFQNPYQSIFENEFWGKEPEAWKIRISSENKSIGS